MKTATSASLILAATVALVALLTPKTAAAGSDELTISERDHALKVGDVVFYDADAGKHVAVPISYLMSEVKDREDELMLVTSVAQGGFRASKLESETDEDGDAIDTGMDLQIADSKAPAQGAAAPVVTETQAANEGGTVVLVIKHADVDALRTALATVLGKDATITVGRAADHREVLAMTN